MPSMRTGTWLFGVMNSYTACLCLDSVVPVFDWKRTST